MPLGILGIRFAACSAPNSVDLISREAPGLGRAAQELKGNDFKRIRALDSSESKALIERMEAGGIEASNFHP
jgi:hypothetical protein